MKVSYFTTAFTLLAFSTVLFGQPDRNLTREKGGTPALKRTALVIGNGKYSDSPLKNPPNDATDIAAALKVVGFEVMAYTDLDQTAMKRAIREFGARLKSNGGVGLFYYAGHGVQSKGVNYLIPVGAKVDSEEEVEYESVDAGFVLAQMESAKNGMNIVILDACRNNPFARASRSGEKGLASIDAPSGTLIAYATAPGSVASDGAGRNGLYTQEFLKQLQKPGSSIEDVFKQVRISVRSRTDEKQTPWEVSSLTGNFYFVPPGGGVQEASAPATTEIAAYDSLSELEDWNKIKANPTAAQLQAFLQKYPSGAFSVKAGEKLLEVGDPEWNRIKQSTDPTVFRAFVRQNPKSPFVDAATLRMSMLTESMIEWEQLTGSKDPALLEAYIANFPDGPHTDEAKALIPNRWDSLLYSSSMTSVIDEASRKLLKDPADPLALRARSSAYCRDAQEGKCKADAEALLKLLTNPTTSAEFEARCYAEFRLSKLDEALVSCTRSIELDPKNYKALSDRASVYAGKELADKALADLNQAIAVNNKWFSSYALRGALYVVTQKWDLAISDLVTYLNIDPKNADAYLLLGLSYHEKNDLDSAAAIYSKAIALRPGFARAYFGRGAVSASKENWDSALADYSMAIEKEPKYSSAFLNRGICYEKKSDYDHALADYTKAIELTPAGAQAYRNRARVYDLTKQGSLAKLDTKKAEELEKLGKRPSN
jgi:tetratricopeptide (TPR) repeat protein